MADQPPILPNVQVPAGEPPGSMQTVGFSDRDNFVRNMVTILLGGFSGYSWMLPDAQPLPPVPVTPSISGEPPVLTLQEIKLHCRIEEDQTDEDTLLANLEMAAHIHTQNKIGKTFDATCGENIKQAMLMLIGHWYRNREATGVGRWLEVPLAYDFILSSERAYEGRY